MQKLSKVLKNESEIEKPPVIIFDNDDIKIIGDGDNNSILQKDKIYILPYLLYNNCILLKEVEIKTFKTRLKNDSRYVNVNKFVKVFDTEVKDNENLNDACRRLLYNDMGILLSSMVDINFETPLFFDDKNTAMNYLVLLKLNDSQYQTTMKEKNDMVIKSLNLIDIDIFIPIDIQTKYLIERLKNIIN